MKKQKARHREVPGVLHCKPGHHREVVHSMRSDTRNAAFSIVVEMPHVISVADLQTSVDELDGVLVQTAFLKPFQFKVSSCAPGRAC